MNRESYDAIANQWDAVRIRLSEAERRILLCLTEFVAPGEQILDLGCGTGRPIAEHFIGLGLRVTGVDQSASMLELARGRLPEQTWVLSALEEFQPEGRYGAAIAWDSLFHIPRMHHANIWRRVRAVLPAGGRFALTLGGMDDHPAFTDSMFDRTFFYDSHGPETALSLLGEAGFSIVSHEFLNVPTDGRDKGRVAIVASAV
jgi:cyclopropane fatty-acyl-phospholipid synthase-like methyltransferase